VEIQETLEKAMVLIRDLTREMNPSIVDRAGLAYALERRVERLRDEFEGRIRFKYQTAIRPPAEITTSLYRIAEIALDNAVRHSRAKKIELAVNGSRALILQVKDDGRGFHAVRERKSPRGVGLLMMEAYARQAGLQLGIESETRTGTIVRCRYAV
jgi:signal transduction histidine kinase